MVEDDLRKSLPDRLEEIIKSRIMSGEISLGSKINIQDFAGEFEISSTPVRDALNRLALRGIIVTAPRVGYFVKKFTRKEADDLFNVRTILETGALETSLAAITPKDLEDYRKINKGYRNRSLGKKEIYTFSQKESIHLLIVERCGNELLMEIYRKIYDHLTVLLSLYPKNLNTFTDHTDILDGITCGNLDTAKKVLANHIRQAREIIDPYIV